MATQRWLVTSPTKPLQIRLKDEVEQKRTRTELVTDRSAADVKRFGAYRPTIEAFINAGGTNGSAGLP